MWGERMEMNSWFTTTIDDARISGTPMDPILTIERNGDEWGDVIVHKSAEELDQIIRENPGTLGGLARLALEILSLRERSNACGCDGEKIVRGGIRQCSTCGRPA